MLVHAFPGNVYDFTVDHYWSRSAMKDLITPLLGEDTFNKIDRSNQRELLLSTAITSLKGGIFILSKDVSKHFVLYCNSIIPRGGSLGLTKRPHPYVICREKVKPFGYDYLKKQLKNFRTIGDLEPSFLNLSDYVSQNDLSLSIIILVKDAESYIPFLSYIFDLIQEKNTYSMEFFILENDSTDRSEDMLKQFMVGRKGKLFSGKLDWNAEQRAGTSIKRGEYMARLRNELHRMHGKLTSNYTVVLDTDVYFDYTTIGKLINRITTGVAMSTSYGKAWDIMLSHSSDHYYDTFAYITDDGIGYKETGNKCMFHGCELCRKYLEQRNLIKKRYPANATVVKVKSAFGGLVVIPTNYYNSTQWTPTVCEHHGWCERLRKHGDILVSRDIETIVAKPRHNLLDRSNIISLLCGK